MKRQAHVADDRLFDCYLGEQAGEARDPRVAEHLAECPSCRARYGDLAAFLESLRAEAADEADEVFSVERLRAQQHQIARRLEHVGRAAKVITFPRHAAAAPHEHTAPRLATRWVAAAAAAGLFVGVGLGVFYDGGRPARQVAGRATIGTPAAGGLAHLTSLGESASATSPDEVFLSELEVAVERPSTPELQPFDALTPHVRDVRTLR